MKFFIDTANLNQIKEGASLGIIDGVTTNPSLMKQEGIQGLEAMTNHYKAICALVDGPISAEVLSLDFDGMVSEAEELVKIHSNIVVKIPITEDGLRTIKVLSEKKIKTNCTLIFSSSQALLAAKAGATFVSPFVGRLDDISYDGLQLIADIRTIFQNFGLTTQVLAASIRHPMHIVECAKIGADVVTAPLKAILPLVKHPLTDKGLAQFVADAKNLVF